MAKGGQGDVGEEGEENSELILFEYSVIKPHIGHVNLIFLIKRENIQSYSCGPDLLPVSVRNCCVTSKPHAV